MLLRLIIPISGLLLLLATATAAAQQRLQCQERNQRPVADETLLSRLGTSDPDTIELYTGEFDASFGQDPYANLSGGVVLRRGNRLAGADSATYDPLSRAIILLGDVRYEDLNSTVSSDFP